MHIREQKKAEMNRRRIIITKRYNVIGPQELTEHPRVRKYWELPREYCLIEIGDCIEQASGSLNSHDLAVARLDEAAMFAPFYRSVKSIAEITTLHVALPTAIYHLVTDRKSVSRWLQLSLTNDWETSPVLHTACRLNSRRLEELQVVQASVSEWATSMLQTGGLRVFGPLAAENRKYALRCEFSGTSGDAAMALFMVLTDAMSAYHLRSVSFRAPKGCGATIQPRQKTNGKTHWAGHTGQGQDHKVVLICG